MNVYTIYSYHLTGNWPQEAGPPSIQKVKPELDYPITKHLQFLFQTCYAFET